MHHRTPFFVRLTLSLTLGIYAGFTSSPWVLLLILPFTLIQGCFFLYAFGFISGYLLVGDELPDCDMYQVRMVERRSVRFGMGIIEGYRQNKEWYTYHTKTSIFAHDSLPGHGTLVCKGEINQAYGSLEVSECLIIQQDRSWLEKWREKVRQRLRDRVDHRVLGISLGVVMGDKSALPRETYDLYKFTGGAHILAVSGLHVGIVYGILFLLLYPLKDTWIKSLIILLMLWGYAATTGFSSSVTRASGFCTFLTLIRSRNRDLYHILALLLFIAVIWDPKNLHAVGLQLSYLAVLGILLFQPIFERYIKRLIMPYKWIIRSITVSLSAQLISYPLVAYYFGGISFAGIFTSLFLIPFAFLVIIVVGSISVAPMELVPWLNNSLLWLVTSVQGTLKQISTWPLTYVSVQTESFWPYYLLLTLVYVAMKWPGRQSLFTLLAGLIFLLARQ